MTSNKQINNNLLLSILITTAVGTDVLGKDKLHFSAPILLCNERTT